MDGLASKGGWREREGGGGGSLGRYYVEQSPGGRAAKRGVEAGQIRGVEGRGDGGEAGDAGQSTANQSRPVLCAQRNLASVKEGGEGGAGQDSDHDSDR